MGARKITDEQLIDELKSGRTQRYIAGRYNMSFTAVNQRVGKLKRSGVEIPKNHLNLKIKTKKQSTNNAKAVMGCGKSDCKYSGYLGSERICNYWDIVGHSRGCPLAGCTKYKKESEE